MDGYRLMLDNLGQKLVELESGSIRFCIYIVVSIKINLKKINVD